MPDGYPFLDREPVEVRSPSAETWHLLGGLQDAFPSGWVLIGGLMVYLLAAEAGQTPTRVTADADVLVRVKVLANGTIRIAEWLRESGIEFEGASAMEVGHRFSEGPVSVDLLVQDHLGERAERRTVGQNVAPRAVGGAGLLSAGELVRVVPSDGHIVTIPRPNLPAALVGKAKAFLHLANPDRHLQDLAFLLGLVRSPVEISAVLALGDRRTIVLAGSRIGANGFWNSANDAQAARAALRIIGGAE